jgi:hypothetical protein
MTTQPVTFSVTFQEIVTLLPLDIAFHAMRNRSA